MCRSASRHLHNGNGDEILTYTVGVGWHEKESKAETQVHGALKAAYYDAETYSPYRRSVPHPPWHIL